MWRPSNEITTSPSGGTTNPACCHTDEVPAPPGVRYLTLAGVFSRTDHKVENFVTTDSTYNYSVSVTIDEDKPELVERLKPVADVQVLESKCIVAIVGRNLMRDSVVGARIFEAMRGIPMAMFSLGTSGLNLSIVVDEADADRSVRAIHAALFEAPVGVTS